MMKFSTRRTMQRTEPWPWEDDHDVLRSTQWFEALFRHAHDRCLEVRFEVQSGTGGTFNTTPCEEDGDPFITMFCAEEWGVVDDVTATIDLAHELGHHESWLRGDCSSAVYAMMYDDIAAEPVEFRIATLNEEARAWRYGREILRGVHPKFPHFDQYDTAHAEAVAEYRRGLLLDG